MKNSSFNGSSSRCLKSFRILWKNNFTYLFILVLALCAYWSINPETEIFAGVESSIFHPLLLKITISCLVLLRPVFLVAFIKKCEFQESFRIFTRGWPVLYPTLDISICYETGFGVSAISSSDNIRYRKFPIELCARISPTRWTLHRPHFILMVMLGFSALFINCYTHMVNSQFFSVTMQPNWYGLLISINL